MAATLVRAQHTREFKMEVVMGWMASYNHPRLHSSMGYLSPMQYEERWRVTPRKKADQPLG